MEGKWIVGYDGYCHLCSRAVRWIRKNDRKQRFRLVPLQQEEAMQFHPAASVSPRPPSETRIQQQSKPTNPEIRDQQQSKPTQAPIGSPDTVLLQMNGEVYDRSTAVLKIALHLRFPWPLLGIFLLVPRFLRDPVYNWVARNRKRWFWERSACYVP